MSDFFKRLYNNYDFSGIATSIVESEEFVRKVFDTFCLKDGNVKIVKGYYVVEVLEVTDSATDMLSPYLAVLGDVLEPVILRPNYNYSRSAILAAALVLALGNGADLSDEEIKNVKRKIDELRAEE